MKPFGYILYFNTGVSQLGPYVRTYLTEQAALLKKSGFKKIYITGHADGMERDAGNLSYERAKNTAQFLAAQGIPLEP